MSFTDSFVLLCFVCVTPWLIARWFRIPRYARYFQQEGYEYNRYSLWLSRNKAEDHYFFIFLIILGLIGTIGCFGSVILPSIAIEYTFPAGIVYLLLFLLAIYFAPRDRQIKQKFAATPRAIRLLVTSFFVELVPALLGTCILLIAYNMLNDPRNSPESMFALGAIVFGFMLLLAITLGPIVFLLTRYTLPLANAINWPME